MGRSDAGLEPVLARADAALEGDPLDAGPGVYRIPLTVHVARSTLGREETLAVLAEIDAIWLEQAGICFESTIVMHEDPSDAALDLFFTRDPIPGAEEVNGIYRGPGSIWSLDTPELRPAPHPTRFAPARTAAHELGHALGLGHQDCGQACPCQAPAGLDCDDLLLRSGYRGFALTEPEVLRARATADAYGVAPSAVACRPPIDQTL